MKAWWHPAERRLPLRLENGATVVVIGGGPAGAFFCLHLLRKARAIGQAVNVLILEGRREIGPAGAAVCGHKKGCHYCAGGISPRLVDILRHLGLTLPPEVVKNVIRSITVQSFWKNIEFKIPADRQMLAVYRGSLPAHRRDGGHSFDAFLLDQAVREGAMLQEAEATDLAYSEAGKPLVTLKDSAGKRVIAADFVVFAGGVNHGLRHRGETQHVEQCLRQLMPGFAPPKLRRALIFELELDQQRAGELDGEILFIEYGSKSLPLEMCSIVPKGQFVTVVLIGPAIDRLADHSLVAGLIHEFLDLPHVRKLIPRPIRMENACVCLPYLVVGAATHPFGDRIAVIGDMATARLYKDGILTAGQTAEALAETILQIGIDADSLERGFGPVIRRIHADNLYGRWVFTFHNLIFRSSVLSRVIYQAIISERKKQLKANRQLENILWKIASGDDWYKNIFLAMIHPLTLWSVMTRGGVITLRNFLTEQVFGLQWRGFGRFTTGVSIERLESKRREYQEVLAREGMPRPARMEFERMYSIKIKASRRAIANEIGRFGEPDRTYFTPRFVTVHRVGGQPNQTGCIIQYRVMVASLCFNLLLEKVIDQHYFIYRVRDGFAREGVLIFEIEENQKGVGILSIYVAFDFYRGLSGWTRPLWAMLQGVFPAYVHDVIWNHSMCQIKDIVEGNMEPGKTG